MESEVPQQYEDDLNRSRTGSGGTEQEQADQYKSQTGSGPTDQTGTPVQQQDVAKDALSPVRPSPPDGAIPSRPSPPDAAVSHLPVRPPAPQNHPKEQNQGLRQEKHAQDSLAVVNDAITRLN